MSRSRHVVARMNNYVPTPMVVEGKARDLRISGVFKAGDTTAFVEAMESYFRWLHRVIRTRSRCG